MTYVTFNKAGTTRIVSINPDMVLSVETSTNSANSMINGNLNLIVVGTVATVTQALNSAESRIPIIPLSVSSA